MVSRFCPKCGRTTESFYDNLCRICFLDGVSYKSELPKQLIIKRCKSCGEFLVGDKRFEELAESVEYVLQKLKLSENVSSIEYALNDGLDLKLEISIYDLKKIEKAHINIKIKKTVCNICNLRSRKYYEGILQVRCSKSIINSVSDETIERLKKIEKNDSFAFISNYVRMKNGFDLFVGSKSATHKLMRYLKNRYKARVDISRKFVGYKKGKKVYKDIILVTIGG
jgi:NMD protein affecting ribosome stability and mRNA decay